MPSLTQLNDDISSNASTNYEPNASYNSNVSSNMNNSSYPNIGLNMNNSAQQNIDCSAANAQQPTVAQQPIHVRLLNDNAASSVATDINLTAQTLSGYYVDMYTAIQIADRLLRK